MVYQSYRCVIVAAGTNLLTLLAGNPRDAAVCRWRPLSDWFEFIVGPATTDLAGAPYGGARFPIDTRLEGRVFARFHLDVGVGDVLIEPLDTVETHDWLQFAGIERSRVRLISREQQFAEKLHAYTLPRTSPNTRVKDLLDMALLIQSGGLDSRMPMKHCA